MPLWSVYEPWGWGTGDADQLLALLRRFGSVTILNGHIHQIVQKVEGNISFHTARSTAYPQPLPVRPRARSAQGAGRSNWRGFSGVTTVTHQAASARTADLGLHTRGCWSPAPA